MLSIDSNIVREIHDEEILSIASPAWQLEIPNVLGCPQETM
jgi:hypothetical protein